MTEQVERTPRSPGPAAEKVDVRALMANVAEEVRRKQEAGLYPPEILVELVSPGDQDTLGASDGELVQPALADLQRSSRFTALVNTGSRRPYLAPVISQVRRVIRTSLTWYMNGILEQVSRFAENTVRTTGLLNDRLNRLDRRMQAIDRSLADVSRQAERNLDYLDFENRFRGDRQEIAHRQRVYVDLYRGAHLPVVDLGCGRGEFLELLRDASVGAYGVDRHPDMVAFCREHGLEVEEADVLDHLAAIQPGSLGGAFCSHSIEHLPLPQVPRFFQLAGRALAPGAPLVVETINPKSLFVFAHALYVDLGHLRPLHPYTLEFLAQSAGFSLVKVEYVSPPPAEFRPEPLPEVEGEALSAVVARVDENFRRIDDILFGPQDFALVAHR